MATDTQTSTFSVSLQTFRPAKGQSAAYIAALSPSTFTQKALIVNCERRYEVRQDFETPARLAINEVKIRSCAVGLNQIDFKSVDYNFCLPSFPWVTGREMAGVVEEVGSAVTHLKRGQRVWTSTYYRDIRAGCFQDFVIVPQHTVTPMGPNMSFASAACLGVCGLTAAMTLWRWFEIPMPRDHRLRQSSATPTDEFMLVWGGSSVTGQFLIQLAKLSKLRIISINSAQTANMVRSLGADHVVVRDGKTNAEITEEIKTQFGDSITRAVDLVNATTSDFTIQCLSTKRQVQFAPLALPPRGPVPSNVQLLEVQMKQFILDPGSVVYSKQLSKLVDSGLIKLPEIKVLRGGLSAVEAGLEQLKAGAGGKKLVVDMLG